MNASTPEPTSPIGATGHPNPYPYYARLRSGPALTYHEDLRLWVASRATVLDQVFSHPGLRVRPVAEPVPTAISTGPAGSIFGQLVRMTDGDQQQRAKRSLERTLIQLEIARVEKAVSDTARMAVKETATVEGLNRWLFATPVRSVAALVGFPTDQVERYLSEFVACFSPSSNAVQIEKAHEAAQLLRAGAGAILSAPPGEQPFADEMRRHAQQEGWTDAGGMAGNLVGLLSQTYEATAGLLGNSIVALCTMPDLERSVLATEDGWLRLVQEVSRFDSPVQNTRRFAAEHLRIEGVDLAPGAAILLVLASANRDPAANPKPDEFQLARADTRVYSFSRGIHACPGQRLAEWVASAALEQLWATRGSDWHRTLQWDYRSSANGRLPRFFDPQPCTGAAS